MSNTADTDGGKPVAGPTRQVQDFIFVRELSEVYLLLDHISGRWDKPLPGANPDPLKSEDDWIEDICRIGWPSDETDVRRAKQASTLVKAKNKLNAAARPATGATIFSGKHHPHPSRRRASSGT